MEKTIEWKSSVNLSVKLQLQRFLGDYEMKKNDLNQMKSNVQKNRLTGLCRKACYVLPTIFLVVFFLSVNLTVHADEHRRSYKLRIC